MHGKASDRVVWHLKKQFEKDAKLRDTYKQTFNYNDIRRDRFLVQCHGLKRADISALIMSVASEKNAIRPGSRKRRKVLEYFNLRDVKARLANDPALLQKNITDGPAFADQDTGDDMYPVLKQKDTPSYIYRLPSREVSPVPPCHSPSEV